MIGPATEQLTSQFYEWEILGRGWLFAEAPVDLEPPFTPFFGHYVRSRVFGDDGVRHTLLSRVASAFRPKQQVQIQNQFPDVSYDPYPFTDTAPLVCLQLHLSSQAALNAHEAEHLLTMLSYCTRPVSFEIIGKPTVIVLQVLCREDDASYIRSQLATFLKGVSLTEVDIETHPLLLDDTSFATVDFGLKEEFMRPIGQFKAGTIDPYTGLLSILEHIREGEQAIFQVLFNGVINHWQSSVIRSVSDAKGGPFFEDAPEMLPLSKEKVGSSLFAATIRLLAQADTLEESFSLLHKLSFALCTNTRSQVNTLLPLSNTEYTIGQRLSDIQFRESHRVGMLLNARELATFVHVPEKSLLSKKLIGTQRKTKPAPRDTQGHTLVLGKNIHNGIETSVALKNEQRLKHTHIIGATGTGKSTLLQSMICEDIAAGNGIAVLDPHGDLIESILTHIPERRVQDVIIIDPADSDYPVGCNILKAHSESEKEILSSDLVAAFRKHSTSWGDQMNSVFANAILAFLESKKGGTLVDLRRFLIERPYRESFLQTVSDPSIQYYWQKEYPLLKTNSVGPILTRLDTFLRPRLIRNMVAQHKGLDFEAIINQKKIVLVKLSQGLIGEENSYLLGSFIVSKIHQTALSRQSQQERSDFFVYIDEFQHFITPSMAHILSGARKYHVGLILAHQDLQQVQKTDGELLSTLLANAGTRICFRVSDADAKRLAEGFSSFEANDLQNLETGEAIARIERPDHDFSLSVAPFQKSEEVYATREQVLAHSRHTHSTRREEVEKIVAAAMGVQPPEETLIQERIPTPPPSKEKQMLHTARAVMQEPVPQKTEIDVDTIIKKKQQSQHRYLQTLIKKVAESNGYKATIEMPTPDGSGSVDVSLEGHAKRIACEVSVTTDSAWELHNIEKCLAAGYSHVYVCCAEVKAAEAIKRKIQETAPIPKGKQVHVGTTDELFMFLDEIVSGPVRTEEVVKGYRVKVEYDTITSEDMQKKRDSVARVVSAAMKKLKK